MLDSGSPRRTMVLRHPQTRVYQPDRASRTACRTATHPADHNPTRYQTQMREILVPHLTTRSPYQHRAPRVRPWSARWRRTRLPRNSGLPPMLARCRWGDECWPGLRRAGYAAAGLCQGGAVSGSGLWWRLWVAGQKSADPSGVLLRSFLGRARSEGAAVGSESGCAPLVAESEASARIELGRSMRIFAAREAGGWRLRSRLLPAP